MPRRWRVAGWALAAVVAGLAVTGIGLRHGSPAPGSSGAASPAAGAGAAARTGVSLVPAAVLPLPQGHPAIVICSPSTGACSMRGNGQQVVLRNLRIGIPVQPGRR